MKAQQVKNAVIVPVGAKGGFFPKLMPANPDPRTVHGSRHRRLQDLHQRPAGRHRQSGRATAQIVPPPDVLRPDGDDPYLVVAADKGTATFSDIANGIALERGFWLGDAFACGGSVGYDHKKMGITARGAWEAVKRHFREMGTRHPDPADFTVIGVGDMSGDVFGNGMLLSQAYPAGGGVRPSPHLPRSQCRCRHRLCRARAACSTCRAPAGTITTRR